MLISSIAEQNAGLIHYSNPQSNPYMKIYVHIQKITEITEEKHTLNVRMWLKCKTTTKSYTSHYKRVKK